MGRAKSPSFVTDLPLRVSPADERKLLVRLDVACQVYNACLGESLKRLALLRQSKLYQAARKMPKGPRKSPQAKVRTKAFKKANETVGFRMYDLQAYAQQFGHAWLGKHLDSDTIQKVSDRAFQAVQQHGFGKRGRPRFKGKNQFDSVEGKRNKQGIRWRDGKVEWSGLELEAIIDPGDPVIAHGLSSRIKYVRIVRRKIKGRNRFYVQLVNEGQPYQKPKNKLGKGVVGIDIGPSTIAVLGEEEAFLAQFCAKLKPIQKQIRKLQRKLDRQRRANNPDNYNPDGTAKKGVRHWHKSERQLQTEAQLGELYRKQAAYRKSLHGQMANHILRTGNTFQFEKLSYRAFQRRYGRSVGMRAPGKFVKELKRKAESAAASTHEFPTRPTRLSQTCHGEHENGDIRIVPKPLSQRWHICDCGIVAQRDLYSAFLAMCVEGERLNARKARETWPGVDALLQAALSDIQATKGRCLPSSFGLNGRRQSCSPKKLEQNVVEAQDVVPFAALGSDWESLSEAAE